MLKVSQEVKEHGDQVASREPLVHQDLPDLPAQVVTQVNKVILVQRVIQGRVDLLDPLVLPELEEAMEHQDSLDHQDLVGNLEHKEFKVYLVYLEHLDSQEILVRSEVINNVVKISIFACRECRKTGVIKWRPTGQFRPSRECEWPTKILKQLVTLVLIL